MKRIWTFISIVILLGLSLYIIWKIIFWTKYKTALDKDYEIWYKTEYLDKDFRGVVKKINHYKNSKSKLVLEIITPDDEFSYGVICVDDIFLNFVAEKDSIFKLKKTPKVTFKKKDGNSKSFELNFCD